MGQGKGWTAASVMASCCLHSAPLGRISRPMTNIYFILEPMARAGALGHGQRHAEYWPHPSSWQRVLSMYALLRRYYKTLHIQILPLARFHGQLMPVGLACTCKSPRHHLNEHQNNQSFYQCQTKRCSPPPSHSSRPSDAGRTASW